MLLKDMIVPFTGWHPHLNCPPGGLHVVGVVALRIHKFNAMVDRNVFIVHPHFLNSTVGPPTV
jgi:hypothetical protein